LNIGGNMAVATMVLIIVIVLIMYIAVGVFTAITASRIADEPDWDDDENLSQAHKYFSWATSICWIIFGLSILGIVLLVILGIVAGSTVGSAAALTYGTQFVGSLTSKKAKTEKEIESGLFGIQKINTSTGILYTFFKIFFGLIVIILTLVGLLSAVGLFYLFKSDSKPALQAAIVSVFLSLLPIVLVIALELANFVYLSKKKSKLEQQEAELRQAKIDIINRRLDASVKKEQAKASAAPQVVEVKNVATPEPKPVSVEAKSKVETSPLYEFNTQPTSVKVETSPLYEFNTQPTSVKVETSPLYEFNTQPTSVKVESPSTSSSITNSLYNFASSAISGAASSLYSFS
jgi:hypothetical protein